jgi:hypothetical protein
MGVTTYGEGWSEYCLDLVECGAQMCRCACVWLSGDLPAALAPGSAAAAAAAGAAREEERVFEASAAAVLSLTCRAVPLPLFSTPPHAGPCSQGPAAGVGG